jgi:hypothetical protein
MTHQSNDIARGALARHRAVTISACYRKHLLVVHGPGTLQLMMWMLHSSSTGQASPAAASVRGARRTHNSPLQFCPLLVALSAGLYCMPLHA